jgi:DNA-binding PadR family transcriptional regulator
MDKQLILLGLLLDEALYGQQINEIVELHADLFAESLRKPTIYYHLERLVADGLLTAETNFVEAPGPGLGHTLIIPRERKTYHITEKGRGQFITLLRGAFQQHTLPPAAFDAALFFFHRLPSREVVLLLEERLRRATDYRARIVFEWGEQNVQDQAAHALVHEHMLALIDADLAWLQQTVERFRKDSHSAHG